MKNILDKIKNRKAVISAVSLVLFVGIVFWAVNSPAVVGASASDRQLPIYCVQREDKTVALSFDAAWGNEDTQKLIDILNKYKIHATFFVVGQWVDKYPESVKALHDAGNEVMSHSDDHAHFAQLTADQITANINASNDKIEKVTGVRPTLFRCPYGEYNDTVISTVKGMKMDAIQWDVDSLDWKEQSTVESIVTRVTGKVKPGSIILFHNDAKYTPQALPMILEKLIAEGYTFVKVADLVATENYTIDNSGMQIVNKE